MRFCEKRVGTSCAVAAAAAPPVSDAAGGKSAWLPPHWQRRGGEIKLWLLFVFNFHLWG